MLPWLVRRTQSVRARRHLGCVNGDQLLAIYHATRAGTQPLCESSPTRMTPDAHVLASGARSNPLNIFF